MANLARKVAKVSSAPFQTLGISKSNTARQALDPGGIAIQNAAEGGTINARTVLDPGDFANHQAVIDAQNALAAEKAKPVIPMPNEKELQRAARLAEQRRRQRGRASTILGNDSETLG